MTENPGRSQTSLKACLALQLALSSGPPASIPGDQVLGLGFTFLSLSHLQNRLRLSLPNRLIVRITEKLYAKHLRQDQT